MTTGDGGGGSEEGGNGSLKNNRLAHSKRCRFTEVECDSKEDFLFFILKKTLIRKRLLIYD